MKVLVTGGCGFIGSHIVDRLLEEGHETCVLDNLSTGIRQNLNTDAYFCCVDIRSEDIRKTFEAFRPDVVFHEAAQIDVQRSISDTAYDADVNITGTINVLDCCREYGAGRIIYASSAAVYGSPQYPGIDEAHPQKPISFYGISKYVPEHYIRVYSGLYGLEYTILRYANVYGTRQDPRGEGGVVSIFIDRLLSGKQPVIYGDGLQTRDFIYVEDVASANLAALHGEGGRIFNISTGKKTSINKLFELMKDISGSSEDPEYGDERKGDIKHSFLVNDAAVSTLDWTPQYSLEEGLEKTIEYYRHRYGV